MPLLHRRRVVRPLSANGLHKGISEAARGSDEFHTGGADPEKNVTIAFSGFCAPLASAARLLLVLPRLLPLRGHASLLARS